MMLCAVTCFFGSGCGHGFYLSESEVAAYNAQLLSAKMATQDLATLQDKQVVILFHPSGPTPHVSSTNLLDLLRSTELGLVEQLFHQIHLDRLSSQIERDLDQYIQGQLVLLKEQGGSQVQIQNLSRITMTILTAPAFMYDATEQSIAIDLRVKLAIYGAIQVNVAINASEWFLSKFGQDPSHSYPVLITIDGYHLPIQLRLSNPYMNAARITLHLAPEVQQGNITIAGGAPDPVVSGISQVLGSGLAGVVDAEQVLSYDNFAMGNAKLSMGPDPLRTPTSVAIVKAKYIPLPHRAPPIVDIVARGADQHLYHARKSGGVWGDFNFIAIPGLATSDPVLVASDNDRLEVAAISVDGHFLHSSWRNGRWGAADYGSVVVDARHPEKTFAQGKPAIAATGAGQIEAIAVGGDGNLYHMRRMSGAWTQAQVITQGQSAAQLPLHDPVTVVGGNHVAVFFVDDRNQIFDMVYDTASETWGSILRVSTRSVQFAPAAASCGDGRVDLVYVGQDRNTYASVLNFATNSISLAGPGEELNLGNALGGPPSLTCSGYQQAELVGPDGNNHLTHNHLVAVVGPHLPAEGGLITFGWQGWNSADDRFFGSVVFDSIAAPVALTSTRTGDVELIGRARGDSAKELYESTYDSSRFAVAPARAVNWRGLEQIGARQFLGNPAVAVSDQELTLGLVALHDTVLPSNVRASQLGLWYSEFGDDNMPNFQTFRGATLQAGDQPASIVSSGPGSVDYFYGDDGGGIQNICVRNGIPVTLPLAGSNSIIPPVTAVSHGNGDIELVGVGRDNNIYHWRRVYGVWQDPIQVPTFSISVPILAHLGAGQLYMFAVGGDFRVHRWAFGNGIWTNEYVVPSTFQVDNLWFGPLAASSWGDGTLDLVVVERGTGKMYHARAQAARVSPDPNLYFHEIGGKTVDTPILMALGATRLGVFALGTDNLYYENWSAPSPGWNIPDLQTGGHLTWPGFEPLTARAVLAPTIVRLSDNDLAALIMDSGSRMYYNRFQRGTWAGFAALPGQPAETRQIPRFRPAAAVH